MGIDDMDHKDWLKWPTQCSAIAIRGGDKEPCGKEAVAVALYEGEEYEPHAYAVCKHHARGRQMLPLASLIRIAKETR